MAENPRLSSRAPKCAFCRNHGIIISVKGHKRKCPNARCKCRQCFLVNERRIVMAKQVALRRVQEFDEEEYRKKMSKNVQTESYWNFDVSVGSLPKDFFKLLTMGLYTDVEIKCRDHSIKAHKIVLCARSKVFNAMLHDDMLEGGTSIVKIEQVGDVVEIENFDIGYLQHFVRYLYTDELPDLTFEMAGFLYEIGDMYAVKSLMRRCAIYFQENLSPANLFECITLAETHSDQELKNVVMTYIVENNHLHRVCLPLSPHYPSIVKELVALSEVHVTENYRYVQTESNWNVDGSLHSLSKDFSILLDSEVDYDVEIKCGDHTMKAHKFVLCARSDIFKTQLEDNTLGGQNRVIEIQDIDICFLNYFVRYLYTDVLPELTFDEAKILYELGTKYGVKNLVHRCSLYFQDNITRETAPECFKLACLYSDKNLLAISKTPELLANIGYRVFAMLGKVAECRMGSVSNKQFSFINVED